MRPAPPAPSDASVAAPAHQAPAAQAVVGTNGHATVGGATPRTAIAGTSALDAFLADPRHGDRP